MKSRSLLARAAALALAATGVSAVGPSPAPASASTSVDVTAIAMAAQRQLEGDSRFGGLRLTPDQQRIQVYTTRTGADLATLVGVAPDRLVVTVVRHSYAEMMALRDRIARDSDALARAGIQLAAWGPEPEINQVLVRVSNYSPAVHEGLVARYGPLVAVQPYGVVRPLSATRLNDFAPWNGGDFIAMDNGDDCTSGPPVYRPSDGRAFLLTAGHCFISGTGTGSGFRVFNGAHTMSGDAQTYMGRATAEVVNNGYDGALIDAPASRLDFRTQKANDPAGTAAQTVANGSVVNAKVCASGAFSGERCNSTVLRINQDTRSFDGIVSVNMVEARNAGVAIVGPGDSGGPVYATTSNGGLNVTGVIIAGTYDGQVGPVTNLLCPQNDQGGRGFTCSDTVWYHDVISLMNHFGVSIKTS